MAAVSDLFYGIRARTDAASRQRVGRRGFATFSTQGFFGKGDSGGSLMVDNSAFLNFLSSKPTIILGSASSSRRGIMDELAAMYDFDYKVMTADIDEKALAHRRPNARDLVTALADAKARAVLEKLRSQRLDTEGYLITCDQVVLHEGALREKPTSRAEARSFIAGYSRSPGSTVGSVQVTNLATRRVVQGIDVTEVHFHPIPKQVIDQLISEGDVFYCAGGLMVEHPLVAPLVKEMRGDIDAVMGLPKTLLQRLLLEAAQLV